MNGLLYVERPAQTSRHCLLKSRKAAGKWVVNLEVERRYVAIVVSLHPMGRDCTTHLLNNQCSALGCHHQFETTIKHDPLEAAPGRYECVLVLFSYF